MCNIGKVTSSGYFYTSLLTPAVPCVHKGTVQSVKRCLASHLPDFLLSRSKTFLVDKIPPYPVTPCPSQVWASAWEPQQAPSPEIQGKIDLTNLAKPITETSIPQLLAWRFPVQSVGKNKKTLQGPTDPFYFGMTIPNDKRHCTQLYNAPLPELTGSLPISWGQVFSVKTSHVDETCLHYQL